jgi:hypothetical protein
MTRIALTLRCGSIFAADDQRQSAAKPDIL